MCASGVRRFFVRIGREGRAVKPKPKPGETPKVKVPTELREEWFIWRIALDERTGRIPIHVLEENYRMEQLQDYHDWLDAYDALSAEEERKAKRKRQ